MKLLKITTLLFIAFNVQNISAQLTIGATQSPAATGSNQNFCDKVEMKLNDNQILTETNCNLTTDYSNVITGVNTISVDTDANTLFNLSTLDLVFAIKGMTNGFSTVHQAIAADFDSDMTISTDDVILMRQAILAAVIDVPNKAKVVRMDYDFSNFNGFDFDSDFTSFTFDDNENFNGVILPVVLISNGSL